MGRRVAAVVLPSFRISLVRARCPDLAPRAPLAVVVDAERDERTLSGGTRIDDVSSEARELGVLPGATIASAKAKCADLRVRVLRPREAVAALEGLAEMLLAFGPIVAPLLDRDAVLVDVTGCAHLHARAEDESSDPERAMLDAIVKSVADAGFSCRAAVAAGPEIAWAIARDSPRARVVRDEDTTRALGELSLDALRLEARTSSYFHRLGVHTIARMRALPRDALTARIDGANLLARVRALLDGDDRTPIPRFSPEIVLEERADLDFGIERHDALFFVLKPLCDRVAARLAGRCALAARLEVALELDRGMLEPGQSTVSIVSLPLASPVRKSDELLAVLRTRFEREAPFRAPVRGVVLRAPELAAADEQTRDLFVAESRAELALPKLAAELSALLGSAALGTLAAQDDWRADRRSVLVPFGAPRPPPASIPDFEPIRLITPRTSTARDMLHVARFERVVWWRQPAGAVDWYLAFEDGAVAFVEVDARGHARVRGFLDSISPAR